MSAAGIDLSKYKKVGKYHLIRTIGAGSYAKVKYAVDAETKESVAIKVIDKSKLVASTMHEQLRREITAMKLVRHKGVVEIKEVLTTKNSIYIVMELVRGGDLLDKIENEGYLREEVALHFFRQMVEAVEACHKHDICHRDLKPENMLLTPEGDLKITDFGMSILSEHDPGVPQLMDTLCGTPNYVAPEVIGGQGYDGTKADIWSLGCIMYVMLAGALPFDGPKLKMFQTIMDGKFQPLPKHVSEDAKRFIKRVLTVEPGDRPSLEDIKKMSFYNKYSGERVASPKAKRKLWSGLTPRGAKAPASAATPEPPSLNLMELVSGALCMDINAALASDAVGEPSRVHRLLTTRDPLHTLGTVADVLSGLKVDSVRAVQATFKVKGEVRGGTTLKFLVRIFQLLPGDGNGDRVCMVEVHKTQGSAKRFNALYESFVDHAAIQALLHSP